MEGVIGIRYAKALINLTEKKDLEATAEQLDAIAEIYATQEDLSLFIQQPKYPLALKEKTIGDIASAELKAGDQLNKFLRFLVHQGRFEVIEHVARSFRERANEILGKAVAQVTLAEELPEKELEALKKQLSNYIQKDVELEVELDPSIIGGAVTQLGSLVLDGSVKNKLHLIRETISKGN